MAKDKIFLICPVRDADPELTKRIKAYVQKMEGRGYKVHWPARDTQQEDLSGGRNVCSINYRAIFAADEIHIWYDETSGGSKFDMGIVYALRMLGYKKKIVIANFEEAEKIDTDSEVPKSFFKVFSYLSILEQ